MAGRALLLVPIVVSVALFGGFGYAVWHQSRAKAAGEEVDALPSARVGGEAPELTLSPLPGYRTFDAAMLREPGVKLVNFWASWCAPCRAEHPSLTALAAEGIPIYGVNYKDDPAKAAQFLASLGDPFSGIGQDATGRGGLDWGIYGVPETFVIDGEGRVRFRFAGPAIGTALEKQLRPAIEDAHDTQ